MENWPVMIRKRGRWFFSVAGEGKSMPMIFFRRRGTKILSDSRQPSPNLDDVLDEDPARILPDTPAVSPYPVRYTYVYVYRIQY
jgi:hypothetical protein